MMCGGVMAALAVSLAGEIAHAPLPPDRVASEKYWHAIQSIGFDGVAVIAQEGRVLLEAGSGSVPPAATFNIASFAKPITAVAVLRLARQRRLALTDPISSFFPGAPGDKRAITIAQLLTHTAGFGNPNGDTAWGVRGREAAVAAILKTPLDSVPGRHYGYSNDGYTLLAAIVEVATGDTWEATVRREVLAPAKMHDTLFAGEPLPSGSTLAIGKAGAGQAASQWGAKGGAGILSTAQDLVRFVEATADGTLLGDGAADASEPRTPAGEAVTASYVFRLSTSVRGPAWSHGGADTAAGHYTIVRYYPRYRLTFVVLGLDDENARTAVAKGLENAAFGDTGADEPPARPARPATGFRSRLSLAGGGLRFVIEPGQPGPATLLPEDPETALFVIARSTDERRRLTQTVQATEQLLTRVQQASSWVDPPDTPEGRLIAYLRQATADGGQPTAVHVIGATPNWVDDLGGDLTFVRVRRARGTDVFRLYWRDGVLRARGGQVYANPAPMTLLQFGENEYGAWHPALGRFVQLRISGRRAQISAGGRTVWLDIQ